MATRVERLYKKDFYAWKRDQAAAQILHLLGEMQQVERSVPALVREAT